VVFPVQAGELRGARYAEGVASAVIASPRGRKASLPVLRVLRVLLESLEHMHARRVEVVFGIGGQFLGISLFGRHPETIPVIQQLDSY
jgi:hypothetical protein